jgi:dipeptidyl aminopeptidase/acylaminoacyl peptidase
MTIRLPLPLAALAAGLAMIATGAASAPSQASGQSGMNEQIRDIREVRGVAVSPDGRQVLTTLSDSTADGGRSHLWLLPADGGTGRQLTHSPTDKDGGEERAVWSADGRFIYFSASRNDDVRLMRLPLDGGEAAPFRLTRSDKGEVTSGWNIKAQGVDASIAAYRPSPDGKTLAILAEDGEPADVTEAKGRKDDAVRVGHDGQKTRLYLVNAETGAAREVDLPDNASDVNWTADSGRLVVVTSLETDDLGPGNRLWIVSAAKLAVQPVQGLPPTVEAARLAGDRLVYFAQCQDDAPPGCNDLYVRDLAGGTPRNLSRGLKGSFVSDFILAPDGRSVVTVVGVGVQQRIGRIALADGAVEWIETGLPVTSGLNANPAQTGWAFIGGSSVQPGVPLVVARLGDKPTRLATPRLVPPDWKPVQSRLIRWQSDGLTIEGLLYLPPDAKGRVPLVVNVHGGPAGTFVDSDSNLVNLLVSQGWAVLQPNPRGGTAYGTAFLAANKNDMGGGDYRDIMAGVDAVLRDYPVDGQRMALIGYSYGGEMAGFVAGRTDRFKALVSGAPVIDQFSEYGTEDSSWYDRWYYGKPWVNFADAWRQSPLSGAARAKTPFLLVQGAEDTTDPKGQSQEMYRALRQEGVPVELILYPRAGHPQLGANFAGRVSREPWHGVDVRRRMVNFIQSAFDGDKVPEAK